MIADIQRQLFLLCEDTETRYADIAMKDSEGKEGAFARGRIAEAKSIRRAMGEIFRLAKDKPYPTVLPVTNNEA